MKAGAAKAYAKKEGIFIPQYGEAYTPSFKKEHKSTDNYFELTDGFLESKEDMQLYLTHILSNLLK